MKPLLVLTLLVVTHLGYSQPHKVVLIEEGTGTWCSWCPRGVYYAHELLTEHPGDVILIANHSGDDMEIPGDAYGTALGLISLPSGHVDRTHMGSDPSEWPGDFSTQIALTPPANVAVTRSYDESSGLATFTVSAEFFETVTADYRLGLIVVEDGVTGPAPLYDQSNSYSGGGAGPLGGWEALPNPVPASEMVYDHVARQMIGDYNGTAGSLPATMNNGETYTYDFSWTLPDHINPLYTHAVGVLIDAGTGRILNAGKSDYLTGNDNAVPFFYSPDMTSSIIGSPFSFEAKAHDSDDDTYTIAPGSDFPAWLTLTDDGTGKATLTGAPPSTGTFTADLEVTDGEHTGYQTLTIEIIDATEDWLQVGETGFTAAPSYATVIQFMDDKPVMMHANQDGGLAWYEYTSDSWSLINTIPSGDIFNWDFGVSPDQTAYYTTNQSGVRVYTWDGDSWNQLGSTLPDGRNIDIAFAADGTPFIACTNSSSNQGYVYKFEDGSWTAVGGGVYNPSVAVWGQLAIDSEGNPAVAYGSGDGWSLYTHVSKFNGSEWILLGGEAVDPDHSTYFEHQLEFVDDVLTLALLSSSATQQLDTYQWSGTEWNSIGANITGGGAEDISMQIDAENAITIAFTDLANGSRASVLTYNSGDWTPIGLVGFTPVSSSISLAFNNENTPFVSYADGDEGEKVSVKKYGEIVGIDELETPKLWAVYPNPAQTEITIHFSEPTVNTPIEIYNLTGELVFKTITTLQTSTIPVDQLQPGLYVLRIGQKAQKIIIE